MDTLANGIGKFVIYGIAGIIALLILLWVKEHIRLWFFKVEYRCDKCHSRFTLLVKHSWDLCTGTLYKTRCLRCGSLSDKLHFYYSGTGTSCGRGAKGWSGGE